MLFAVVHYSDPLRINRYIMECKFVYPLQSLPPYAELIDTLWNVNVSTVIYGGYPVKKINRYIIE